MPTCNVLPYGGCGIGKYDSLFGPLNQYMILHWTFLVVIWVGPAGGFFPFCGLKLQGIIAIKSAFWLWQLYMADGSKKKVGPKALRLHHLHPVSAPEAALLCRDWFTWILSYSLCSTGYPTGNTVTARVQRSCANEHTVQQMATPLEVLPEPGLH